MERFNKEINLTIGEQLLLNGNVESFEMLLKIAKELEQFFKKESVIKNSMLEDLQSSDLQASRSPASSYYLLKNETGCALSYWLRPSSTERLEPGHEGYIRNNVDLDVESLFPINNSFLYDEGKAKSIVSNLNTVPESCFHGKNNSARHIVLNDSNASVLYVDIEGIKGVLSIKIDDEGQVRYERTDSNSNHIEIICEARMSYERGQKEIIVRSNYQLVNLMTQPMMVRLLTKTGSVMEEVYLRESERKFVPLNCLSFGMLQCHICDLDESLSLFGKDHRKSMGQTRFNRQLNELFGTKVPINRENFKKSNFLLYKPLILQHRPPTHTPLQENTQ